MIILVFALGYFGTVRANPAQHEPRPEAIIEKLQLSVWTRGAGEWNDLRPSSESLFHYTSILHYSSVLLPISTNVSFRVAVKNPSGVRYEWHIDFGATTRALGRSSSVVWAVPSQEGVDYVLRLTVSNANSQQQIVVRGQTIRPVSWLGYKITSLGRNLPAEISQTLDPTVPQASVLIEIDFWGRTIAAIPQSAKTAWSTAASVVTLRETLKSHSPKALEYQIGKILSKEGFGRVTGETRARVLSARRQFSHWSADLLL